MVCCVIQNFLGWTFPKMNCKLVHGTPPLNTDICGHLNSVHMHYEEMEGKFLVGLCDSFW